MSKQARGWFFLRTDTPTTRGTRFRNGDKPPQPTFQNLVDSTLFFTESSDRAKVYSPSTTAEEQVGHVVLVSDNLAKSNSGQMSDRSLVVQPSQLPTVAGDSNNIVTNVGSFNDFTIQVLVDPSVSTRNNFLVNFTTPFVNFFQDTINTLENNLGAFIPLAGTTTTPVSGPIQFEPGVSLYTNVPLDIFNSVGAFSPANTGHFPGSYANVLKSQDNTNGNIYTEQSQNSNFLYQVANYRSLDSVQNGTAYTSLNYLNWSYYVSNNNTPGDTHEFRMDNTGFSISNGTLNYGTIDTALLNGNRTYQLPDNSGTIALVSDIPVIPGNIIYNTTSSSSHPVDCATKTFVVSTGLAWKPGNPVRVFRTSDSAIYMVGTVQSYSGTNLTVLFNFSSGIGTFTDWSITLGNGATYVSETGGTVTYNAETDIVVYTPGIIQITRALISLKGSIHNDDGVPIGNIIRIKKNGLEIYKADQSVINGQQEFINFSVITQITSADTISVTGTAAGGDERMENASLTITPLFT